MQKIVKKVIVLLVGWGFVALGVIGLFLPVLQGILFLLIGLLILSTEYVWAHRLVQRVRARFPAIASKCDDARVRAERWIEKLFSRSRGAGSNGPNSSTNKPKDIVQNF